VGAVRPRAHRPSGRHFLAPRLAADFVRNAGITRGDLVVEIGAGTGVITGELASRAGRVVAIELDAKLARSLRARFARGRRVEIVHGDALCVALPQRPFRVVGNLPFAHTTVLLHRLLDEPTGPLLRADVIVQWGTAVKRCSQRPSTLQTTSWAPWFEFTITRRLPASNFRPPPSVDCAVMTITRRPDPLLDAALRPSFVHFLTREFRKRRNATDLDVWQWVGLFSG
jgi:23S rRNA (adenine-N6)-dimethyltransferase